MSAPEKKEEPKQKKYEDSKREEIILDLIERVEKLEAAAHKGKKE